MILSRHNTLLYLVNQGLLSHEDLVTQSLAVRPHGQRNRGFSVTWPNGQGYYVKQHRPDAGPWEPCSSLVNEARVLAWMAKTTTDIAGVPRLYHFDRQGQTLVIDWWGGAMSSEHLVLDDTPDPTTSAHLLGHALGRLHHKLQSWSLEALSPDRQRLETSDLKPAQRQAFDASVPWVLRFDRLHPLAGDDQSWAQARLVALIGRYPTMLAGLAELAERWPGRQLIHGDMKWQNCLVRSSNDVAYECQFIDWEMASLGDPLWDLAGLAQSWLKQWADTLPEGAVAADDEEASHLLSSLPCRALGALCQAYQAQRPDTDMIRLTRLCGARLIQTVYEECTAEDALSDACLILLQLAHNLLLYPADHLNELWGRAYHEP